MKEQLVNLDEFNMSEEEATTTITKADLFAAGDERVTVTVKAGDVELVAL